MFSCSKGITSSKVCALDDSFDALKGCDKHTSEFNGTPETVVYSFQASGVDMDAKVQTFWYFEESGKYLLVDSFTYYTKLKHELIVSGIDRNFLPIGNYLIKTTIKDDEKLYEHEERFKILSNGLPNAVNLVVGNAVDPNGQVMRPELYFDQKSERIFVSAFIQNAKPNSEITIHFTHTEMGKFSKTFQTNTGRNPKNKFLLYAYLPNVDLPLGEYRAEILLDGASFAAPFFIDATRVTSEVNVP